MDAKWKKERLEQWGAKQARGGGAEIREIGKKEGGAKSFPQSLSSDRKSVCF